MLMLIIMCFCNNVFSQDDSKLKSYIVMKDGEKVEIASDREITFNKFKEVQFYKPKSYKNFSLKIKKVEKIIDGDKLYLPYKNKKGKFQIFRQIAKNSNYILGYGKLKTDYTARGKWRTRRRQYFMFFDHNYNLIEEGYLRDVKHNEITENIDKIEKEFGDCIGLEREDYFKNITVKIEKIESKSKVKLFSLRSAGRKKKDTRTETRFLDNINQIDCTGK